MFDALSGLLRRQASLSVPILDGVLKPNNRLEDASVFFEQQGLEDLALGRGGEMVCAYGRTVARLSDSGVATPIATYSENITALSLLQDGTAVVATGTKVIIDRASGQDVVDSVDGRALCAVTALHVKRDGTLLICDASSVNPYDGWSRDLMEKRHTGRVLVYDPATRRTETLADGLGFAFGVLEDGMGRVLISESWRHQICVIQNGRAKPVLRALPGYPARLASAAGGGFWLTLFACRTQLIEFVLREDDYRREMMRTIDPSLWVAPAMSSGDDFLEPLQGGSVKMMGVLKPWAPPRSYGLVVRVSEDLVPLGSLHSRVGGHHHGIVAVAEHGDNLFALSKGAGRILGLSTSSAATGAAA